MNIRQKIYIAHYELNKRFPKTCFITVQLLEKVSKSIGLRNQKRLVLVYGEPRSGTSFVTGLLNKMGLYAGPYVWLLNANQYNPDGYFECVPFQNTLDKYLEESGFNFEHNLPKDQIKLPEHIQTKLKKIVENGNIELVKYNKFSIFADSISELFPEAIWIHVDRDEQDLFKSNSKFIGGRDKESFFNALKKRKELWSQSKVSHSAFNINYSALKKNEDIHKLVIQLQTRLKLDLSNKQIEQCVSFFRPKD